MNESVCIREFETLAAKLDLEVRYINEGPSGLCTIRSRRVMFIDKTLDNREKLDLFVRDFKTLDLEGFFVVPVIRELLGIESENFD